MVENEPRFDPDAPYRVIVGEENPNDLVASERIEFTPELPGSVEFPIPGLATEEELVKSIFDFKTKDGKAGLGIFIQNHQKEGRCVAVKRLAGKAVVYVAENKEWILAAVGVVSAAVIARRIGLHVFDEPHAPDTNQHILESIPKPPAEQ